MGRVAATVPFLQEDGVRSRPLSPEATNGLQSLGPKITSSDKINISLIDPLNNSIVKGGTSIIIEFLDENGSVVSPVTELYRWDYGANFESILRPLPVSEGSHTLEVEVESESGIWSSKKFAFKSDNTPPQIILTSPENETYVNNSGDIRTWDTNYVGSLLAAINVDNIDFDSLPDILVGGSNGRLYAFNGRYGTPIYLTPQYATALTEITVYNQSQALLGLANGDLIGVNTTDGNTEWTNSTGTSPVIEIRNDNDTKSLVVLNEKQIRVFNYSGNVVWDVNQSITTQNTRLHFTDYLGDNRSEIILVNETCFVKSFNISDGVLIFNFSTSLASYEYSLVENDTIYISSSNGYVEKYNLTDGSLIWTREVAVSQNIYQITKSNDALFCSASGGSITKLNATDGAILWSQQISSSYIKYFLIEDFNLDNNLELLFFDGNGVITNMDVQTGDTTWNYGTSLHCNGMISWEVTNDSINEVIIITTEGTLLAIDPRSKVPNLVPSWTNVTIGFQDSVSNGIIWEKYSWDGNPNQSYPGVIPATSGIHTLDVWASDNASNIAHAHYEFYAAINILLNGPPNNSRQQSGTYINLTLSEAPLEALYKWDAGVYQSALTNLPVSEVVHHLYIILKDQSFSTVNFHYVFTTDDTPITSITLLSPTNDTIVEGGEALQISFSEIPFIELYNWDGGSNITTVDNIPVSSDTHVLDVYAADEALNWKSIRFVFYTKIQIDLDSHTNDTVIDPTDVLCFSFGEPPDTYVIQIDNSSPIIYTDQNQTLNMSLHTASKTYRLTISVNDSVNGRWNNETYLFVVRIFVNITSHADGGFAETGDPLTIYFSDPPITRLFSWDGNKNSSRMPVVPAPDGAHYLDIYVGNIEGQFWHYHYDFNVDTDLIDILLINPVNNTKINSWENVTFDFSEPPFIVSYQWDNASASTNLTDIPSIDGIHILNVTVEDEAGNTNSRLFSWIVDDTPIDVQVFLKNNDSVILTGEYLNLTFDEAPVVEWYRWDNNGGFSPTLPPNPHTNGTHSLNVTVYDGLNWNIEIFNFTVQDLPPIIEIDDPTKPYMSGIILSIEVNEDLSSSWHKWDDEDSKEGLVVFTPEGNDGYHTLQIFAVDMGGSTTTITLDILLDNTPISITELSPGNNSQVRAGTNVTIVYSEEPYNVSYSWDGNLAAGSLSPIPTNTGEHKLNIRAYDEAGNVLNVDVYYVIPTPIEDLSPYLGIIGIVSTVGGVLIYVKRETVRSALGKIKDVFKPPRQVS